MSDEEKVMEEQVIETILNVQNNLVNTTENIQTNLINTIKNAQNNIITSISQTPSYLYSLVLPNATFERNSNGGILSFDRFTEDYSIIQFSDRPFRESKNITMSEFINLFKTSGINSFQEDPPNGVLLHDEEQRTYSIKLFENNLNELDVVKFHLNLLPGQTHNLNNITGRISFFVDDGSDARIKTKYTIKTGTPPFYIATKNNSRFKTQPINAEYVAYPDSNELMFYTINIQSIDIKNDIETSKIIRVNLIGSNGDSIEFKYKNKYYLFTVTGDYQIVNNKLELA